MPYKVTIQPSQKSMFVNDDETLLDAALRNGLPFPYACRDGACATCKGKILSGSVDYGHTHPRALTEQEKAEGLALFCQARPLSDLVLEVNEVSAIEGLEIRRMPCKVTTITRLNHDVMLVRLKPPASHRLRFLAGQYIDFLLSNGEHRSFSLANAPFDDEQLELHIRKVDQGSFSDFVFNELKEKAVLRIEGPHGSFFLREDSDNPIILMAGGTGFAPVKSLVEQAFHQGITRPIHLYWGVRARRDLYMAELPEQWQAEHANFHYTPVLSEPRPEDNWQGRSGYVHEAIAADFDSLADYDVYACGPPAMVYAGRDLFISKGLKQENCYSDAFEFQHPGK